MAGASVERVASFLLGREARNACGPTSGCKSKRAATKPGDEPTIPIPKPSHLPHPPSNPLDFLVSRNVKSMPR